MGPDLVPISGVAVGIKPMKLTVQSLWCNESKLMIFPPAKLYTKIKAVFQHLWEYNLGENDTY